MRKKSVWVSAVVFVAVVATLVWIIAGQTHAARAAESPTDATQVASASSTAADQSNVDMPPPPAVADTSPPTVTATGPVPAGIVAAAAAGDPIYQIAKSIWESGGQVIPTGDGQYVVPLPDQIPAGFAYPTQVIPAHAPLSASATASLRPPHFLAHNELGLYRQAMGAGSAFKLVPGADGYLHVVQ